MLTCIILIFKKFVIPYNSENGEIETFSFKSSLIVSFAVPPSKNKKFLEAFTKLQKTLNYLV